MHNAFRVPRLTVEVASCLHRRWEAVDKASMLCNSRRIWLRKLVPLLIPFMPQGILLLLVTGWTEKDKIWNKFVFIFRSTGSKNLRNIKSESWFFVFLNKDSSLPSHIDSRKPSIRPKCRVQTQPRLYSCIKYPPKFQLNFAHLNGPKWQLMFSKTSVWPMQDLDPPDLFKEENWEIYSVCMKRRASRFKVWYHNQFHWCSSWTPVKKYCWCQKRAVTLR